MKSLNVPCRIISVKNTALTHEENKERISDVTQNLKVLNISYLLAKGKTETLRDEDTEELLIIPESNSNVADVIVGLYDLKTYIKYHHDSFCELVSIGSDKTYAMGYLKPTTMTDQNEFYLELDGTKYRFIK